MTNKSQQSRNGHKNRQIVGFSLSPELAREVKLEAAKKNVSLKQLFEEMWALYQRKA